MASKTRTIITRLQTMLRAINGAGGGYVYTLTDSADRVLIGDIVVAFAEAPPRIYITDWVINNDHDHALGDFGRTLLVTMVGIVGATTDEPGSRMLAATDLLDDICQCLDADRGLAAGGSQYVNDVIVRTAECVDGEQFAMSNLGALVMTVEINWWAAAGEGA